MPDPTPTPSPQRDILGGSPQPGAALCLSGGGYRAMLFHVGCLWRLNETGLLGTLKWVSSVSGGSIAAGVLGANWAALGLSPQNPSAPAQKFQDLFVTPMRNMASTTIDEGSVFAGICLPGSISDRIAGHYDSLLFHGKTLQDLPSDGAGPRFVINATNVQSGVLMRFSKPYMRDYRVGQVVNPKLPLARAVAASSAFPPVLSPCEIDVAKYGLRFEPPAPGEDLNRAPFNTNLVLSDGGVYDNLGLESAWKQWDTLLVSDGGAHVQPEEQPHSDWARHALRIIDLMDSQVRALRVREVIDLFACKHRQGTYWGIGQEPGKLAAPKALACDFARTTELARTPTRLQKMDGQLHQRLINWGYALCDASVRAYYQPALPPPAGFPYPDAGV